MSEVEINAHCNGHEQSSVNSSPPETSEVVPLMPAVTESPKPGRMAGGGLSELSKQLRVLQAKNTSQAVEIDRLERQLRILADLQGVSVADLRNALHEACQAEAFGELQQRVASLRAQLESASLTKHHAASVSQEAAYVNKIANLELRVGELEEVEEKHRGEIEELYNKLMEQQDSATQLEVLNAQLQSENEELKMKDHDEIAASEEDKSKERIALQKDNTALKNRLLEASMNVKTLTQKIKLAEQQRQAIEQQVMLRHTQFKARFMVQEETIKDLEQQLASLYAAFVLMRDEKVEEDNVRQILQTNLGMADAEVARHVEVLDQSTRSTTSLSNASSTSAYPPESPITQSSYIPPSTSEVVLRGVLLVKSTLGIIRKWKKREVVLFSSLSHHYLDIAGEGGIELHVGSARVEPYAKFPFALLIHAGNRTVIAAAALNETEYNRWMSKLLFATTGSETNVYAVANRKSPPPHGKSNIATKRGSESRGEIPRIPSLAEREESDLQKAIEMSQREV
jgi:hypothetical protein